MVSDILLCLCDTVPKISHQNKVILVFDRIQLLIVESKSKYDIKLYKGHGRSHRVPTRLV